MPAESELAEENEEAGLLVHEEVVVHEGVVVEAVLLQPRHL